MLTHLRCTASATFRSICMGEDKNENSGKMVALTALFLISF